MQPILGRVRPFAVPAVVVWAFLLRLWNLGYPDKLMFDETYYAKDAWALVQSGVELNWSENANQAIESKVPLAVVSALSDQPAFVAHPPLGKWIIGLGEMMFGLNSFGWRIMACVFGTALVLFTMLLVKRLSNSLPATLLAGVLLGCDGLALSMSRIALLDIFQATFIVAAVWAFANDAATGAAYGWFRPWRWACGVLFGLACAVKWNSMYVLAAFGVLMVVMDAAKRPGLKAWLRSSALAFVALVGTSALVYLVSWAGWFASTNGWDRQWGRQNPDSALARFLGPDLSGWVYYHKEMLDFHTSAGVNAATHPYASNPWLWPVMQRPIAFDAINDIAPGSQGCPVGPNACLRVIDAMGTPVLWWVSCAALVFVALVLVLAWLQREASGSRWQLAVVLTGFAATWLPWCLTSLHQSRPLFFFYAVLMIPFMVSGLALVLDWAWRTGDRRWRIAVGLVVALVVANFAYFYPVLTDGLLSQPEWLARMWLSTWI